MRSITLLSVRDAEFVDNFLRSSKDGEAAISSGLPDSQAGAQTLTRDIVANSCLILFICHVLTQILNPLKQLRII